eukprot:scaffold34730_cov112-Isochrysis_galbana.AAC.2
MSALGAHLGIVTAQGRGCLCLCAYAYASLSVAVAVYGVCVSLCSLCALSLYPVSKRRRGEARGWGRCSVFVLSMPSCRPARLAGCCVCLCMWVLWAMGCIGAARGMWYGAVEGQASLSWAWSSRTMDGPTRAGKKKRMQRPDSRDSDEYSQIKFKFKYVRVPRRRKKQKAQRYVDMKQNRTIVPLLPVVCCRGHHASSHSHHISTSSPFALLCTSTRALGTYTYRLFLEPRLSSRRLDDTAASWLASGAVRRC